jgi:hypothetical protein
LALAIKTQTQISVAQAAATPSEQTQRHKQNPLGERAVARIEERVHQDERGIDQECRERRSPQNQHWPTHGKGEQHNSEIWQGADESHILKRHRSEQRRDCRRDQGKPREAGATPIEQRSKQACHDLEA